MQFFVKRADMIMETSAIWLIVLTVIWLWNTFFQNIQVNGMNENVSEESRDKARKILQDESWFKEG